ncbi:MAG: aldehyde dehydrogenase [Propionibacteriaceae bacterium]|jgi:aldehyde dehydrogenase (NAD+)|nr:aldehyde dehydrogenase [Propionibacteriaceae bacterium]
MVDFSAITERQRAFFATGLTKDVSYRQASLQALLGWIRSHDDEIMAALKTDLNKPPFEAYATEVGAVLDELKFACRRVRRWSRPKRVASNLKNFPSGGRRYPQPYGVALILTPWNYPFMLTVIPMIAALAAGNCAVVKPSAYSPATSSLIARMCADVFDPGHVTVVEGGRQENAALLNERYDIILFTGSTAVGRVVMEAASRHLTPVILELGGKSPCIVDETANLKLAARRIAWGKFMNAGQTCVAPDYLLVHQSVKSKLVEELGLAIQAMFTDQPCANPDYPRIVNDKHFQRLLGLLAGERIVVGGGSNPETLQIEPTVLDAVSWDSAVMGEEIFGPLLPVLTYTEPAEAVQLIGARPKPLATYLFTSSAAAERYFLKRLSFGGGCINDTVVHLSVPRLPFGGVGDSGMGSYHGKAGFDAFTHYRSVLDKSTLIDIPLRYPPYTKTALTLLKKL